MSPDRTWTTQFKIDLRAKASRDLVKLDSGPLALASGYEFWRESSAVPACPERRRKTWSRALPRVFGSRNIDAIYGSCSRRSFGTSIDRAVRYDDYSDVGGTTNPKVGISGR